MAPQDINAADLKHGPKQDGMMDLRPLLRGIALRCPACGKGRLFASYNRIHDRCAACGVDFHASRGEWTGALMFAQGFFGFVALFGWYVMFLLGVGFLDWRGLAWLLGWGALAPILFYPSFKGAWIGLMQAAGGLQAPGDNTRP